MKMRGILTVVVLALATGIVACDEDTLSGPGFICDVTNPVRDVLLAPASAVVLVHSPALSSDTVQLKAVATNRFGAARTDVRIGFSSSDTTVATVDTIGVVHARRPGTTRITASACGESSSAQVTVILSVSTVDVSPSSVRSSPETPPETPPGSLARAFAPDGSQPSNVKFTLGWSSSSVTVVQTSGIPRSASDGRDSEVTLP